LLKRTLEPAQLATLHYFLANAFEVMRLLSRHGRELYEWAQPEMERQIVHLRTALIHAEGSGRTKRVVYGNRQRSARKRKPTEALNSTRTSSSPGIYAYR